MDLTESFPEFTYLFCNNILFIYNVSLSSLNERFRILMEMA